MRCLRAAVGLVVAVPLTIAMAVICLALRRQGL